MLKISNPEHPPPPPHTVLEVFLWAGSSQRNLDVRRAIFRSRFCVQKTSKRPTEKVFVTCVCMCTHVCTWLRFCYSHTVCSGLSPRCYFSVPPPHLPYTLTLSIAQAEHFCDGEVLQKQTFDCSTHLLQSWKEKIFSMIHSVESRAFPGLYCHHDL